MLFEVFYEIITFDKSGLIAKKDTILISISFLMKRARVAPIQLELQLQAFAEGTSCADFQATLANYVCSKLSNTNCYFKIFRSKFVLHFKRLLLAF